jgi:hypothetical protein
MATRWVCREGFAGDPVDKVGDGVCEEDTREKAVDAGVNFAMRGLDMCATISAAEPISREGCSRSDHCRERNVANHKTFTSFGERYSGYRQPLKP